MKLRQEGEAFRWSYQLYAPRLWLATTATACLLTYTLVSETGLVMNRAVWLLANVFIGRVFRDWIWLRDVVDSFPFLEKVLNWQAVQDLAGEGDTGDMSG